MQNDLQQLDSLLQQRRIGEAEVLCRKLTSTYPDSEHAWIQAGRICQMKGDLQGMLANARQALKLAPESESAAIQEVEASLLCNELGGVNEKLISLESKAANKAPTLQHIAILYTQLERHADAMRCYQQAHTLTGDDPQLLYNMATAATALGNMDEARQLYDRAITKNPHDYAAYYNRSVLNKQSQESNHIVEMESLLKDGLRERDGIVQLGYALAKEYEDIGDYPQAFANLKKAADCRKSMLAYDVAGDVSTMADIKQIMTGGFFDDCPPPVSSAGPIFILGQPRSGTTLVDRIISSHSEVESLGEINDFVLAFMQAAGAVKSKSELVQKTAFIDNAAIGKAYKQGTRQRSHGSAYLVDKTPANFLYIGLIAKALPNAKIIHLRRDPMDSCYAMYKTLFRMGYPFSYSLEDLGAYYLAYHQLMAHWRELLPGRILDVDYEALVADQEAQSKRLIAHCGLEWQAACLDFHKNKSASATASAAQVRQPIYKSSVEKWRNYESELAPLSAILRRAGIVA